MKFDKDESKFIEGAVVIYVVLMMALLMLPLSFSKAETEYSPDTLILSDGTEYICDNYSASFD